MRIRAKLRADQTIRRGDTAIFRVFKMAAVGHLKFTKVENFNCRTVRRTNVCHRAKFCADRTICCRDMAIFSIFLDGGDLGR